MLLSNRYTTAAATIMVALGIGFVMQSRQSPDSGAAPQTEAMDAVDDLPIKPVELSEASLGLSLGKMEITDVARTSAVVPKAPEAPTVGRTVAIPAKAEEPSALTAQAEPPSCDVVLDARTQEAAMVALRLQATCLADLPVTLHHSGMMFNAHTDAEGMLAIVVPSLAENAVFIAAFDNGFGAAAATSVPDVTKYERIVVQWQGRSGIELHALEFDADYNSAGHVWSSAQRDPQVAIQGQGGFITMLGDQLARDSRIAEVYSFPAGHARRSGAVNLSVEAEITAANCGQDVSAQTIEYRSGGPLKVQDIQLFMPGCDTIGDFLVLKNVLEDLKIASN